MGPRSFNFFRAGGFDQVRFENGQDFINLDQLDWKLWVALACPTKGLAFDSRTLELIDADKDGRIRAPELIAAIKWAGALLKNPDDFLQSPAELSLASINLEVEEGKRIHDAAKTVLRGLGKGDATVISVPDSAAAVKAFHDMAFNGDGVIPPESTETPEQKQLVLDVMATIGNADDKSGKKGVNAEQVKTFFAAVAEYVGWITKAEGDPTLMPLGTATVAAYEAMKVVRAKVEDYFARCAMALFDARAAAALNREEKEYLAVAAKDLTITSEEIKSFPLSRIEGGRALPLLEAVNPAWAAALATFTTATLEPVLGEKTALTEAEWAQVTGKLAVFGQWQSSKVGGIVEKLGVERLKVLDTETSRALLDPLFALEKAQEPTANSIASVEKLVRYTRDLFQLTNNFVSFKDFYERKRPAIFQVGTLFLDQRECELVIRVDDPVKHAVMAPLSRGYLVYCECARPASNEKMNIVAAFTAGESDNLMVGRNGLFKDRDGKDWDATITRLVDNPISIRQAFWSPYKKVLRFVEEQVAKRAAEEEKDSNALLADGVTHVGKAGEEGKVVKEPQKLDIGVVAALGVAVGGITAAMGALLQSFFGLGLWMPLGVVGLLGLISGPSMLIAWLKLRQRNIGPLLDANGWAVNAHAMLNIPFGASLTKTAALPAGSKLDTRDPYAEARKPWRLYITFVILLAVTVAWYLGKLDHLLPAPARSVAVLGPDAPAAIQKPEIIIKAEEPPKAPEPAK
ncbi:MAG: hypothetical protein Q8N23_28400 [Archangium sp.]|nr:hypothetical protein [Archangium sp.]MDP3576201.1 hypothetical protein [Archangium sp.]